MSGPPSSGRPRGRPRSRLFLWVAVACIAAVVIEAGIVTDGFGLGGLRASHATSPAPPGPNPNPYDELITSVVSAVTYGGATEPFSDLAGAELCPQCPQAPTENSTSYDPPVAGIWFYFNATNSGGTSTHLANFTLGTSGPNPSLFELVSVVCCYSTHGPAYSEVVTTVYFTPGTTYGFRAYAIAASIPYDGSTGYALYFNATSP